MRNKSLRTIKLLVSATTLLVAQLVVPEAAHANVFGYYRLTPNSVNSGNGHIRGIRASITNFDTGSSVSAGSNDNIYLNRVDIEFYPQGTGTGIVGLVQVGMGITSGAGSLDSCGGKTNVHDVVEYKSITGNVNTGYHCAWYDNAFLGAQKKYTVGQQDDTFCSPCYEMRIDGDVTPDGAVFLGGYGYGQGDNVYQAVIGGEVGNTNSGQHGRFQYGATFTGTNWGWTNQQISSNAWNSVNGSTDVADCGNQDGHYAMTDTFAQGGSISRYYNDTTCT